MADSNLSSVLEGAQEEETITELEITPLVAVALVLVIVFMVTAPILLQPNLDVILPKAITGEGEERENVSITITKEGMWAVNEVNTNLKELPMILSSKIEDSKTKYVIIRADQEALHKYLMEALSISKKCGAKTISVAVEQKNGVD